MSKCVSICINGWMYDENGSLVGLEIIKNFTNIYHITNDDFTEYELKQITEYELEQIDSVLKNRFYNF